MGCFWSGSAAAADSIATISTQRASTPLEFTICEGTTFGWGEVFVQSILLDTVRVPLLCFSSSCGAGGPWLLLLLLQLFPLSATSSRQENRRDVLIEDTNSSNLGHVAAMQYALYGFGEVGVSTH